MKSRLFLIVAASLACASLTSCAGFPRVRAEILAQYKNGTIRASYDGKTITSAIDLGDIAGLAK